MEIDNAPDPDAPDAEVPGPAEPDPDARHPDAPGPPAGPPSAPDLAPSPAGNSGDGEMARLDSRLVPYWILVNLVTTAVLVVVMVVGVRYLGDKVADYAHWLRIGAWTAGAMLLLMAVVQPVLAYLTWRYSMDHQLLIARYGILFREEKTIPISRLQHVDLRRGPIERMFSLATLVVFTAGTEGATFRVPGLSVTRAQEMRDRILAARGDDVI